MKSYTTRQLACIMLSCESSIKKRYELYESTDRPQDLFRDYTRAHEIVRKLQELGAEAICIDDPEYPQELLHADPPPLVLYCRGDVGLLAHEHKLAVVGTRRPTRYGREVTTLFVRELVQADRVIVSGMARGIDACAHRTCLGEGGKTIAVVATGVDLVYPAENKQLAEEIIANDLMISEYPPGTPPMAFRFPERNRIISGLVYGVLIPEAGLSSGSLITADMAIDQGKELYLVPGNILSPQSMGCNQKLKELQGTIVTSPRDLLPSQTMPTQQREQMYRQLSMEEQRILDILHDEDKHFSEILEESQLSVSELSALLTQMELYGLITKASGNYYGCVPQI